MDFHLQHLIQLVKEIFAHFLHDKVFWFLMPLRLWFDLCLWMFWVKGLVYFCVFSVCLLDFVLLLIKRFAKLFLFWCLAEVFLIAIDHLAKAWVFEFIVWSVFVWVDTLTLIRHFFLEFVRVKVFVAVVIWVFLLLEVHLIHLLDEVILASAGYFALVLRIWSSDYCSAEYLIWLAKFKRTAHLSWASSLPTNVQIRMSSNLEINTSDRHCGVSLSKFEGRASIWSVINLKLTRLGRVLID